MSTMPDIPYALPENTELSDWIPHDGGPRPVSKSALVHVDIPGLNLVPAPAAGFPWHRVKRYCTVSPKQPTSPNDHYRQGDIECIDAIRAALTDEEWRGFCKGNVLKYTWRERHKGGDGSLLKAQDYLRWALAGKAEDKR
jgi:hypothetical protein